MLGLIDDVNKTVGNGFKNQGDAIVLIGAQSTPNLGGSEYVKLLTGEILGDAPEFDIDAELRLQKAVLQAIRSGIIQSAHDCAEEELR